MPSGGRPRFGTGPRRTRSGRGEVRPRRGTRLHRPVRLGAGALLTVVAALSLPAGAVGESASSAARSQGSPGAARSAGPAGGLVTANTAKAGDSTGTGQ